jgi:hypothetical protein
MTENGSVPHADEVTYRLSWEMVNLGELWRYSNANPLEYENTTQTVPNSQIPDEHWSRVTKDDTDPHAQYRQLKEWADADTGFVRNVTLKRLRVIEEDIEEVRTTGPCREDVPGTVPSWAGEDQIDPCTCALPIGHDGVHKCSHDLAKENDG